MRPEAQRNRGPAVGAGRQRRPSRDRQRWRPKGLRIRRGRRPSAQSSSGLRRGRRRVPPDLAAQVMSQSAALKADELSLRYSVRDASQVREELLAVAVSTARRKAERLAHAAERSLGAIVTVDERMSGGWEDEDGGMEVLRMASSTSVDLQPGDVTLAVTLRVTFAL